MLRTNDSSASELLARCVFDRQDARDLPDAFRSVVQILSEQGLPYAFVGRLGRARFCRAQWTDLVEVRIDAVRARRGLVVAMKRAFAAALSASSSLSLEITFVRASKELRFLKSAAKVCWFDTNAQMASAEHLLWLALSANSHQDQVDAIDLIEAGCINWLMFDALSATKSLELCTRLRCAMDHAARAKASNFGKSVASRTKT